MSEKANTTNSTRGSLYGLGWSYVFSAILFIAAVFLTSSTYWGDTQDYVDSLLTYLEGGQYRFIDFGHLFWRPLGWVVWTSLFDPSNSENLRSDATFSFQILVIASGFVCVLIFVRILHVFRVRSFPILFATLGFVCAHTFLNYSQAGNSYVPGLMCYMISVYFALDRRGSRQKIRASLSGVFLAFSFCFWVAFTWTIPAALMAPLILFGFCKTNVLRVGITAIASLVTLFTCFGVAISALGIRSVDGLLQWITQAAQGAESTGVMSVIWGMARSFINLGSDAVLFKRFLHNDPFNPVTPIELLNGSLGYFLLFYLMGGVLAWALYSIASTRSFLYLLMISVIPVLVFASFIGGGEIEWHLTYLPYIFVGVALILDRSHNWLIVVMLGTVIVVFSANNLMEMTIWKAAKDRQVELARVEQLLKNTTSADAIFLLTSQDPLDRINDVFPYDPIGGNRMTRFRLVLELASAQTSTWREEFSVRSLSTWEHGGNVWLSVRVLSPSPKREWNWVESDDRKVVWRELPMFFNNLEFGETLGGTDGFVRVLSNESNRRFLEDWKGLMKQDKKILLE